ncbi:MAG: hypothetical protein HYX87_07150 [Chloroflexi bacterium]|nr:hypothetical protein [Chloroflexota bacterium]
MGKTRRWLIAASLLAAIISIFGTSGIALAGWEWCDDPLISIGNDQLGYTTTNIEFATDDGSWGYSPTVSIAAPAGVDVYVLEPHGSVVNTSVDSSLSVAGGGVQTRIIVLVPLDQASGTGPLPMIKVRVSSNGRVLAQGVGSIGDEIVLQPWVPVAR